VLHAALHGQTCEVVSAPDPARALFAAGRVLPHAVILDRECCPHQMILTAQILREEQPDLPVFVVVGHDDGEFATSMAALQCTVIRHPLRHSDALRILDSLRPGLPGARPPPIDLGRLRIARGAPEIWLDGVHVVLPRREHELLSYLAEHAGRVVTHAEIGREVWGSEAMGGSNTVAVHVTRLRRRLRDSPGAAPWIRAVRGVGYQLEPPTATSATHPDR
jgi:DNA-binding response OmpR family regulator